MTLDGAGSAPQNITDLEDLAVAVRRDRAEVVVAVSGDGGCKVDGCYAYHQMFSFALVSSGTVPVASKVPTSALGISPTEDAVPITFGDELFVLSQGHKGAASVRGPGDETPGTTYLLAAGKIVRKGSLGMSGRLVSKSDGADTFALGVGWNHDPVNAITQPAATVQLLRLSREKNPENTPVASSAPDAPGGTATYHAPALDVTSERVAIAYLRQTPSRAKELWAAWVDRRTGRVAGKPARIVGSGAGAPAVLVQGDTMHVVFATRTSTKGPYTLTRATWRSSDPAPAAPAPLAITTRSAVAPAVTRVSDLVALAWADAEDERRGAIYAGFGKTLEEAATNATRRSDDTVKNARDPEWGAAGKRALLAWTEHDGPRRVRASWCAVP